MTASRHRLLKVAYGIQANKPVRIQQWFNKRQQAFIHNAAIPQTNVTRLVSFQFLSISLQLQCVQSRALNSKATARIRWLQLMHVLVMYRLWSTQSYTGTVCTVLYNNLHE